MDANTPVPKDIPLPLPVPEELLVVFHVLFFAMHILFVNLMLGGAILTLIYEIRGRWRPDFDALAREISKTITVNKSLAVVMGVGPLLFINLLYTTHFYSATLILGKVWILIVPLVIVAFLLAYLHKYSWDRMRAHKGLHILMIGAVVAILLSIPLIFLSVINLMLFPDQWNRAHGFVDALLLPNVFPRYLHFIAASFAVIGLFMVKYTTRAGFPVERLFKELTRAELKQEFYTYALGASAVQFIIGPLVFLTLPAVGMNARTMLSIGCGVVFAAIAIYWMWREIDERGSDAGRRYWHIVGAITLTVTFMVIGRHLYRAEAVADHQAQIAAKTAAYELRVKDAQNGKFHDPPPEPSETGTKVASQGLEPVKPPTPPSGDQAPAMDPLVAKGEKIFKQTCVACHAVGFRLIGPPITEIYTLYKDNPDGIAKWAQNPTPQKRAAQGFPPMLPMPQPYDDLKAAGAYMLHIGAPAKK